MADRVCLSNRGTRRSHKEGVTGRQVTGQDRQLRRIDFSVLNRVDLHKMIQYMVRIVYEKGIIIV